MLIIHGPAKLARPGGFSLLGMVVALGIGSIVVSAVIAVFGNTTAAASDSVRITRLNQELRSLASLVAAEVRRAGYRGGDPAQVDIFDNAFQQGDNDIAMGQKIGEAANSCLLFSYDLNNDGAVDDAERRGYRLNSGTIEFLTVPASPLTCDTGSWQAVTNNLLAVNTLSFQMLESCLNISTVTSPPTACQNGDSRQIKRLVNVAVAATATGRGNLSQSLSRVVRIRNDKIVQAP